MLYIMYWTCEGFFKVRKVAFNLKRLATLLILENRGRSCMTRSWVDFFNLNKVMIPGIPTGEQ